MVIWKMEQKLSGILKILTGDATRPSNEGEVPIVIPHVCNDIGRWGSGFVNAITARWGEGPREAYLAWHKMNGFRLKEIEQDFNVIIDSPFNFELGNTQIVKLPNKIYVANMVAQHQVRGMDKTGRPPIRYGALTTAMMSVRKHALSTIAEIHCPKFGSDLAGGDWDIISQLIQEIWIDNGIDVTVYEFEG